MFQNVVNILALGMLIQIVCIIVFISMSYITSVLSKIMWVRTKRNELITEFVYSGIKNNDFDIKFDSETGETKMNMSERINDKDKIAENSILLANYIEKHKKEMKKTVDKLIKQYINKKITEEEFRNKSQEIYDNMVKSINKGEKR